MSLRTIFALSCGDIVHDTFSDVWNEGLLKQLWVFVLVMGWYTVGQNLFYAILMEGYDRAKLRGIIDGDDPFPTIESLSTNKKIALDEPMKDEKLREEALKGTQEIYDMLETPGISDEEKNVINLLLFNLQQVLEGKFL